MNDKVNIHLDYSEPKVMTIVNVTPDSFFADSRTFSPEEVVGRVAKAVEDGTDMIDVGGFSSRPGAEWVSAEEELRRVLVGVEAVRRVAPAGMPVSVDTFRASVAEGVIERFGACIINDISAGELDADMVGVAAKYGVPYIAMHMKGTPQNMQSLAEYDDIVDEVSGYLLRRCEALRTAGVTEVIADPGFGFAKSTEQNFTLLFGLDKLCKAVGVPVLAGVSRKSMIYKTLGITPEQALNGTTAINWECLRGGASILRVHDTLEAVQTVELFKRFRKGAAEQISKQ